MNYWKEIAKILGVELEEEFIIKNKTGLCEHERTYRFTNLGLIDSNDKISILLTGLIQGDYIIEKKPWKPEEGVGFWFIDESGHLMCTNYLSNNLKHRLLYKSGNCFKNSEEARKNAPRIVAMLKSDKMFVEEE